MFGVARGGGWGGGFGIGLDTGLVLGGLLGEAPGLFNIWGEALEGARAVADSAPDGAVQASEAVYSLLRQRFLFRQRGLFYRPGIGEARSYVLGGAGVRGRRVLAIVGFATRRRLSFTLQVAALLWGVVSEGVRPSTWRRTVRAGFRTSLTRLVAGSFGTVAVTAGVVGLGLVFEALYWLRTAGQEEQIGRILVVVLFREIAPLLIGIILLGRGGAAVTAELGVLKEQGEIAVLRAEGFDLFQYLVLPRAVAFALASFTLGVTFIALALLSGFMTGSLAGVVSRSFLSFLDAVLRAMTFRDLAVVPAKLLLIGLLIALVSCATGLGAREADVPGTLLPRAFTRGITGVLLATLALSAVL